MLETRLVETHPPFQAPQAKTEVRAAGKHGAGAAPGHAANRRYVSLFRQLPALLPPQLWLTHIEQRGDRLYISGCSKGYPPLVTLRRRLADHAPLPDVL